MVFAKACVYFCLHHALIVASIPLRAALDRKAIARCVGNCFSGCHSNTYKIYHDADISAIGLELSSIDYK